MKTFKSSFLALTLLAVAALTVNANAATRYRTDEITSESGGPVSFPAGITSAGAVGFTGAAFSGAVTFTGTGGVTVPTAAAGTAYSDSASLTLTAGTNVAAVVTPVTFEFFRLGKQVCAYGQVSIDPTSSATASTFTLTLPVVPTANFSGTSKLTGTSGILVPGMCLATNGAKTATCNYVSGGTAVELVPVWFCYSATGA